MWRLLRVLQCLLQDVGDSLNHHSVRSISGSERSPPSWRRLLAPTVSVLAQWSRSSTQVGCDLERLGGAQVAGGKISVDSGKLNSLECADDRGFAGPKGAELVQDRRDPAGELQEKRGHCREPGGAAHDGQCGDARNSRNLKNEVDHVAVGQVVQCSQMLSDAGRGGFFLCQMTLHLSCSSANPVHIFLLACEEYFRVDLVVVGWQPHPMKKTAEVPQLKCVDEVGEFLGQV